MKCDAATGVSVTVLDGDGDVDESLERVELDSLRVLLDL